MAKKPAKKPAAPKVEPLPRKYYACPKCTYLSPWGPDAVLPTIMHCGVCGSDSPGDTWSLGEQA